jgi:hypothetical protein
MESFKGSGLAESLIRANKLGFGFVSSFGKEES